MLFNKLPDEPTLTHTSASRLVTSFQYRPMVQEGVPESIQSEEVLPSEISLTEEAFAQHLARERALGVAETEALMKRDHEQKLAHERARITESIRLFEQTRKEYFAKVEGEVVQLALSVARKILHREAQVDPLLLTALVQIALTQIKEGSSVAVRVRPEEASRWREQLSTPAINLEVTVIEDSERVAGDCVVETELGSVNFSLAAQLKEVEQGFLDVLARTPQL